LTGNADLQTAMAAVNQGHIFQFLLKPCAGDRLIQSVTAALLQHNLQIAERELLRMQLETSDKMVAIGKLAAGITHDLNNILGAILMQTELEIRDARERSAPENPALNLIHEAATSAAALTRDLNCFSRCERIGMFQNLQLPDLIEASLRIARPLLKNKLKLHTDLPANLPAILGDAEKLKQAVINLLLNARDATPDGGTIWITARLQQFSAAEAGALRGRRPGHYVCLAVRDTGCGMDPATQQNILKAFFTTKPVGKGSGLGLFMVRRVLGQHDGWLELESAPGQGSTFQLYLPIPEHSKPKVTI
jgi:two-component system cell cycle sensor histidine kinase/response regulator CckA